MFSLRLLGLLLMIASVSACSWFGDKQKQPNELTNITQRVDIQRRWEVNVGSGLGALYRLMPPVIDKDRIYANDYKGRVYAFDRKTGAHQWRQSLDLDVASGVGISADLVLIASLDGDVIALDKESGEERWRSNVTSEVLAPPQSNGSVVVIQTNDGKLFGLDAKTGESMWTYTTQLPVLTLRGTATPQVFGPNVITGFANGKLIALSALDGTAYWERRIARPQGKSDIERVVDIDGTPVISGQLIYATSYNGTLSALTPRGGIVWSQTTSSYSSPVVIDNKVIVSTAEGWMKAFNAETGVLIWESKLLSGRKLAAPQNLAGFAVTADYEGYVHVFDTDSGSILDRFRIDRDGVRSPMVSDGSYLYVLCNDGVLASIAVYLFKPKNGS
jgi:outer membrane protein assembly factor BamB